MPSSSDPNHNAMLKRELGVFGATMMGMGSIVGTGVFVSIGIAAGIAGPSVIIALAIAAALAVCNALSSAQLAANHPVSGGTYEYGYRYLSPSMGFIAGWLFLCAKIASAATAALGFAGYLLRLTTSDGGEWINATALATVIVLTLIVLAGVRQSNRVNIVIVLITLASLVLFVAAGLPMVIRSGADHFRPFFGAASSSAGSATTHLLQATALMFVAYTGYGRIATLGEEVLDPRRTIPRAIIITLILSAMTYIAVAAIAVGLIGSEELGLVTQSHAAPLEIAASAIDWPAIRRIIAIGAMTAMLGVLLNLLLGLSRVLLAMGRRRDIPSITARLNMSRTTPVAAVIIIGGLIALLALVGSIKAAWSFSAFTVLCYYAITNLAALRLRAHERLYHQGFAWSGLFGCLFLAAWIDLTTWIAGLAIIAVGLLWQRVAQRHRLIRPQPL